MASSTSPHLSAVLWGKLACIAAYSGSVILSAKAFTTRKHAASTFARPRVRRPCLENAAAILSSVHKR